MSRSLQAMAAYLNFQPRLRVLDVVAELRDALDYRIWREDPDDTHLTDDVQTWCELAHALTDYLKGRAT